MLTKETVSAWFMSLQDDICNSLEERDGTGKFREDKWTREAGGGGRTRIIQGQVIEKGGVNYSAVHGAMPENIAKALNLGATDFYATGVSIVLHPHHPFIPIIHMNVRYFETSAGPWWFGGGIDVTPHYLNISDARFFHNHLQNTCNKTDNSFYPKFKKWADDYFYIRHRNETRGIGGIFFDKLNTTEYGHEKEVLWDFVQNVGLSFVPIYLHLSANKDHIETNQTHKDWQYLRRGRYVEFNLVWDRGTKFGLDTNGRTESILMSLPPMARWEYDQKPLVNSPEANTLSHLRKEIDWINYKE